MELTLAHLHQLLHYDPETGAWTRIVDRAGAKAGARAEAKTMNGYRQIVVDRRRHLAHRLAWFYVHGRWPIGDLDHIDRNRANNAIANLREVTRGQNTTRALRLPNKVGVRGVQRRGNRYRASIRCAGRSIHLGYHDTVNLAHAAYVEAAQKYFGECAEAGAQS